MTVPRPQEPIESAYSHLSADELLIRLSTLAALKQRLNGAELQMLQAARNEGASLGAIADALGVSRQAVHNRLRNRCERYSGAPESLKLNRPAEMDPIDL